MSCNLTLLLALCFLRLNIDLLVLWISMLLLLIFLGWDIWALENLTLALFDLKYGLGRSFILLWARCDCTARLLMVRGSLLSEALSTSWSVSALASLRFRELLTGHLWINGRWKLLCSGICIFTSNTERLLHLWSTIFIYWSTSCIFYTATSTTVQIINIFIWMGTISCRQLVLNWRAVYAHTELYLLLVQLACADFTGLCPLGCGLGPWRKHNILVLSSLGLRFTCSFLGRWLPFLWPGRMFFNSNLIWRLCELLVLLFLSFFLNHFIF